MFNPTLRQKLIHQYEIKTRKIRAKMKRNQLVRDDFSIISNNCWGG